MSGVYILSMGALLLLRMAEVRGTAVTPYIEQSFFFDWNKPNQPFPVPVTQQCEVNHIVWARGTAAGPNPTAPYHLQVYSSAYTVPFIIPAGNGLSFDWAVPFAPGTLYQICMFDKFGNTGGCQDTYTVIPSASTLTPTCTNVTFPPPLSVTATVNNGPMSQYGWIDQCSDISLQPTGGTPPYTLTVAPSLHPPYNITSSGDKPINWTLSLDWSSRFFIGLSDSAGGMWANGPLHAGGGGTIACLSGNTTTDSQTKVGLPVTIGSGIGGLVVGLLLGTLGGYFMLRRHIENKEDADRFLPLPSGQNTPHALMFDSDVSGQGVYQPVPTMSSSGTRPHHMSHPSGGSARPMSSYQIEPFTMPDEHGQHQGDAAEDSSPAVPLPRPTSYSDPSAQAGPSRNVYVVHHDSEAPPVTIYHGEETQVVELPPRYLHMSPSTSEMGRSEGNTYSDSRSEGGSQSLTQSQSMRRNEAYELKLHQPRQPNRASKPPR